MTVARQPQSYLWLATELPDSLHHGGVLRLINLARELARNADCYLVILHSATLPEAVRKTGVFTEILTIADGRDHPSPWGQLRWSNTHFLRRRHPRYFRDIVTRIDAWLTDKNVGTGIAFTLKTAEVLGALPIPTRVVDDYDCRTLTLERHNAVNPPKGLARRVGRAVHYRRTVLLEGSLTSRFDLVTTISPADRARLVELSPLRPEAIAVVKNGVDERLLSFTGPGAREQNAVVFWGDLGFPPNREAVHHFFSRIYEPLLAPQGVRWHIVGGNADNSIRRLGEVNRLVTVAGFVPDLAEYVSRYPVMVNPLVSGSGLKNKALEAFALRLAVVSTAMGAEAIEANPGTHYLEANSPAEFAGHVLACLNDEGLQRRLTDAAFAFVRANYRWRTIGERLQGLLDAIPERRRSGQ
jgi:glycosyltransferase involved in cell wall biosynthesis